MNPPTIALLREQLREVEMFLGSTVYSEYTDALKTELQSVEQTLEQIPRSVEDLVEREHAFAKRPMLQTWLGWFERWRDAQIEIITQNTTQIENTPP